MQPVLVYKTPLWKEVALLLLAVVFAAVGAACIYGGYLEGRWDAYIIGFLTFAFGLVSAVLNLSTNTVLRLDAEGVFVQTHMFWKRRVAWSAVERFEKTVQTFNRRDRFGTTEQKMAYLTIVLKRPEELSTSAQLAHAALGKMNPKSAADSAVTRQREGHYNVGAMQLPGNIDDVVREVRAFHTRVTNGAVSYDPNEVFPSSKGSHKPSLLSFLVIFGMLILLSLGLASYVTGMSIVEMGSTIFD